MSSYKLSIKYKGNLNNFLRCGNATAAKSYLAHLWTRRSEKLWHEEASQQTASKDVPVDEWAAFDQEKLEGQELLYEKSTYLLLNLASKIFSPT